MAYPAFEPALVAPLIAAGAVSIAGVLWTIRLPVLAMSVLIASLVTGQLLRLPLPGQGGGLLLSDIAAVLILGAACTEHCLRGSCRRGAIPTSEQFRPSAPISMAQKTFRNSSEAGIFSTASPAGSLMTPYNWLLVLTPFLIWSLFGLAVNASAYTGPELAVAAAYWARLAAYLCLIPALITLVRHQRYKQLLHRSLLVGLTALLAAGALQFWLLSDLTVLQSGWDPHAGRLVGTWLDPNFFGAFWLLVVPYLLFTLPRTSSARHQSILSILTLGAVVSLLLTKSRSTLVASAASSSLLLSLLLVSGLRYPTRARLVTTAASLGIFLTIALLGVSLLGERAAGLIRPDDTVTIRLAALAATWPLARDHAAFGVGYNAYQFAAERAGLIDDFTIHSRAGADISLLTLWITTGPIGIMLFFLPWLVYLRRTLGLWIITQQSYLLVGVVALVSLLTHSLFVNSLLYPHLLLTLAVLTALTTPPA